MVKALIDISERANRVFNIVKAQHNLKDKSQAIDFVAGQFEDEFLDLPLRPSYIRKAKRIMKDKGIYIGSAENLRRRYLGDEKKTNDAFGKSKSKRG